MNTIDKISISEKKDKLLILFLIFTFGGIFGFIYEELFYLIDLGYLVKRGTTFGPWIPIYGFGAILIIITTNRIRRFPVAVFAVAAIVSGILEFVTGYVLLHIQGVRLWDYNTEIWNWGNIGGYICARSVLFFGVSALFLQYAVYPMTRKFQTICRRDIFFVISVVPAALFVIDIIISRFCGILF